MLPLSKKSIYFIPFISIIWIFFFACAPNNKIRENIPNISDNNKNQEFAVDSAETTFYSISPGDEISLQVFRRSNLKQIFPVNKYNVQENGLISVPLVGNLYVEGLTIDDLNKQIYTELSKTMVEPIVYVTITHRTQQKVLVAGEVKKPGIYPIKYDTSALESILLAGGFSANADKSLVVLIRTRPKKEGEDSNTYALSMNIKQYLAEKKFEQNVILKRGDIVFVPDNYMASSGRFWQYVSTIVQPFSQTFGVISSIVILSNTTSNE